MRLDDLLKQTSEWIKGSGPNSDIVMSSRVRLARNFTKFPFVHWANKEQLDQILSKAQQAVESSNYMKGSLFLNMAGLSSVDKQFLLERHLISREHAVGTDHKALFVGDKEIVAIMINEEDHLRMQVMQSGLNLSTCWDVMSEIDADLETKMDFAFSPEWGYLTACPTNTGTGMRASVMMHLPSMVMTRQINRLIHAVGKLGLTVRGFYGEGTEALGHFFQISNQVTLGLKEEDIIDNIQRIIKQITDQEQSARKNLISTNKEMLEDKIWRAMGTLKAAHIITSNETIELLSLLRLGVEMGLIKDITRQQMNELFLLIQPAHLQKQEGKSLNSNQRDVKRANLIREKLGG